MCSSDDPDKKEQGKGASIRITISAACVEQLCLTFRADASLVRL